MRANRYLIGDAFVAHQISRRNDTSGLGRDLPHPWRAGTLWIAGVVCVWLLYVVAQLP